MDLARAKARITDTPSEASMGFAGLGFVGVEGFGV